MSQTQRTYQTTTTLNVSQDYETPARSSPPPEQAPPAGVMREVTDLVEDSLNANARAVPDDTEVVEDSSGNRAATITKANGPADRPSQQAQSQHDELYSLTPDRARTEAAQHLPKIPEQAESQRKVSNNALDALLARGATVHKPVSTPARTGPPAPIVEDDGDDLQRSQGERNAPIGVTAPKSAAKGCRSVGKGRVRHTGEDEEDELQSFDDAVSAPIGSHPRSSKGKGKASTAAKPVIAGHTNKASMTSKVAPVSATGSLAALGQRRGQDTVAPTDAPKQSNAESVLQPRDANVQTPASLSKDETKQVQPASTASVAGKLPPVRRGMFARTHIGIPSVQFQKQVLATAKAKETVEHLADDSSGVVESGPRTIQQAIKRQALKRPAKTMKDTSADEASTYDVPQSPEDEDDEDYRPSKKTWKGKAAQRKRIVATSSAAGTPGPSRKTARKSKAKASKPSSKPDDQVEATRTGSSMSTRLRMKAESGTVAPATNAKKGTTAVKEVQKDIEGTVQPDTELPDAGNNETDDGPTMQFPEDYADQPSHGRSAATSTSITKIKRQMLNKGDSPKQKGNRSNRDRGASQHDAIELSDAQPSSDEESSPVLENQPPGAPTQPEHPDLGHRHPHTPAAMRFSPPIAGKPSIKPTTAGLVDPESVRKSTIISFDKSGPRNQGTASSRASRPSLAPTAQSSTPPAADGSLARLQAKRQVQPSSAAKSSKSFAREASAAPSNVAADAQEALAALKRKTIAQSQPLTTRHAAPERRREERIISKQAHIDEEFADFDQFGEDTTLIGDEEPPPETKIDSSRPPRTLSQMQMPPPFSKADLKRPVNKAPTVPSMMRAEAQNVRHPSDTAVDKSVLGKRQYIGEPTTSDIEPKRARREQAIEPTAVQQSDSQGSFTETTVVQCKPPIPGRQAERSQRRASSQRQTKRQRSQGTVDMHGSPVPEGMVVDGLNTVLETFSQHAAISSDKVDTEGKIIARDRSIESSDLLHVKAAQKQPVRMSSNSKAVPAEPSQESQAITHVARVEAGRQPFVTTVQTVQPPTDPFTSSEKERVQAGKGSSTSAFSEHLKQKAAQVPANRKMVPMPPPPAEEEEDDPEKTLVEEEAELSRPQRRPKKRIESFDSQSSSAMSTDTEDASTLLRDMGVWRTALKPHQMNLFDELIIVAHRVVRHLAGEEEASTTIVDDYRRRGEELVQSLRVGQAKDVKEYYESLKVRKKTLQRELYVASEQLRQCSEEVKAVRREVRKQAAGGKGDEERDGELRDVLEAFC